MKNKFINYALGLTILSTSTQAATIAWGTATAVDTSAAGGQQVSTTGTVIEAFNAGNGATGTTIVNGVTFTNTDNDLLGNSSSNGVWAAGGADSSYNTLLSTLEFGGGGNFFTINVGGGSLTINDQYEIQVWFVDDRSGTDARVMSFSDSDENNSVDLNDQFVIGTFTADGTSQALGFDAQSFGNAHINAYQVRAVPEPSSTALLGLGGLALILRRRK